MSFWLADPELFLYAKGTGPDEVHLLRCKKPTSSSSSSSLVVPMKSDDFNYVSNVKNHLELIGDMFDWDETDYKRLVKYVYEKRLLLNGQGFVIAELLLYKDGNKTIDGDVNDEDEEDGVPAIYYIRSLDVLPLKSYIPKLRVRPIPLRTVKYLGDVNGETARVEHLETENIRLESKNKIAMMEQDSNVTKLTARVEHLEAENIRLESKNKIQEGQVTKLTIDLTTQKNNANAKEEVWMNDIDSLWVGFEGLGGKYTFDDLIIIGGPGTYTVDKSITNVRASYWCKIKLYAGSPEYTVVSLEDLTPNKERARFSKRYWLSLKSKGKAYVYIYCHIP